MAGDCSNVHCGFWIDWTKGGVLGSTLTLPSQYGFILSALLALFIRIIGDNLWGIACFIFHQIKATPKDRDDFYHQIQIVLRNAASESRVVRDVIKICQSRNTARLKAYIRGLPLVVIAGLHILAIFAAGTFSSNALVRQENEVLVRSDTCGWLNEVPIEAMTKLDDKNAFDITNKFVVKSRARYRQGASYSRGCYRQDGTKDCNTFVRKVLPSTVNISAPCPFDQKICNGPAISVDTGFIYSDSDLGINTKPENRISGRKTLQCVSLRGEDYTDGWISLTDEEAVKAKAPPNATIKGYKLGTAMQPNPLPYIFWVDNLKPKFGSAPYWVRSLASTVNNKTIISIEPIPELQKPDSDVTIASLFTHTSYSGQITDPWFNASDCNAVNRNSTVQSCSPSNTLSFLGCTEQYQFCNSTFCSSANGLYGFSPFSAKDGERNIAQFPGGQDAVFQVVWKLFWAMQLDFQLGLIGHDNLIASDYLWSAGFDFGGLSAALPENQWQIEVANWMNTSLAQLQDGPHGYARGNIDMEEKYVAKPETSGLEKLCHRVKVKSADHVSFSALGIFLELALGVLVIVVNMALPWVTGLVQHASGKGEYKRLLWIRDSVFQLQRMAAEGRGVGPWVGVEDEVPRLKDKKLKFSIPNLDERAASGSGSGYERIGKGKEILRVLTGRTGTGFTEDERGEKGWVGETIGRGKGIMAVLRGRENGKDGTAYTVVNEVQRS